jgi:D-glucosaminate-6-phosphate ammonia-lyase
MLGDKDILMAAWQASAPHHGPGRDNKVGREEMVGMLAAVHDWAGRDHDGDWKRWLGWLSTISKKLSALPGVKTEVFEPKDLSNKSPVLNIVWDPSKIYITGDEVAEEVGRKKPRIALGSSDRPDGMTSINITTGQMQPGEEIIVANRIYGILSQKREPMKTTMEKPSADLNGKWDVFVKFFNSSSEHQFNLSQDGNWINGTHKGDLSLLDLDGTIEGDQVKFRSSTSIIGDHITYIFSGKITGDSMAGDIHLGEYRTATFTAKRNKVKPKHRKITVPGGPPLAT